MFSGGKGFGKFQYVPGNLEGYTHAQGSANAQKRPKRL